jgi:SAM-dependent methyltransferase
MSKPFNPAAEKNKNAIFQSLLPLFGSASSVLEIGSGTGQHAVFFSENIPHCTWQCSETALNFDILKQGIVGCDTPNLKMPIVLDVRCDNWGLEQVDIIFSSNTAHFMPWSSFLKMLSGVFQTLKPGGFFCLYGPFHYRNKTASVGDYHLDKWLESQGQDLSIRNFEEVVTSAANNHLVYKDDFEMPANNHLLIFQKISL